MSRRQIITAAHWGALKVTVENGRIIRSEGALPAVAQNELQSVAAEQVYSPARVKYPMVRRGYPDGCADRSLRGRDQWVRVDWEQALTEARRRHGDHGAPRPSLPCATAGPPKSGLTRSSMSACGDKIKNPLKFSRVLPRPSKKSL